MELSGGRALVTGASSGIGRATAMALAEAGCSLVLTGRDGDRLNDLARTTGGAAVVADLRTTAGVERLVRTVQSRPSPDLVVQAAGVGHLAPQVEHSDDDLELLISTNLLAPIRVTRALLPAMVQRAAGRLVFVTSIAGRLGTPDESVYAASKGALDSFASSLAAELVHSGVGVTTVVPGVVDTPFFERRGEPYQRRFPRPVPAERVAAALVRAVRSEQDEVVVPGWLRVPIALRACAPRTYARLARRWG